MKRHMIIVMAISIFSILFLFQPVSTASDLAFPLFITEDSPDTYLLDIDTEPLSKVECFTLRVELSRDGKEILVYAENRCKRIVKLVRFSVTRGPTTEYFRPDVYIEEGLCTLIYRGEYRDDKTYVKGDYFKVNRRVKSNIIE